MGKHKQHCSHTNIGNKFLKNESILKRSNTENECGNMSGKYVIPIERYILEKDIPCLP